MPPSRVKLKPAPNLARRLVPMAAAASYAGVSTKTIRRRISDGSLQGFRIGSRVIRVDLTEVDALLDLIPTVGNG